jgi:ribose transport system ATP-binding protein
MVGSELEDVRRASAPLQPEHGDPLAAIVDLRGATVFGVSLEIRRGDLIGIAGITGSGREALLSLVFGATPRTSGSVEASGRVVPPLRPDVSMRSGMAFVPADRARQASFPSLTCRENITVAELATLWRWPKLSRRRETAAVSQWVNRFGVRPADPDTSFSALSGGNQQKVVFARWLRRSPIVLLLDEPTQGVDVGAKADIHAEILRAVRDGAGVVVSSSDTDELAALCHRVLVLRDGRVFDDLRGARITPTEIAQACMGTGQRSRR